MVSVLRRNKHTQKERDKVEIQTKEVDVVARAYDYLFHVMSMFDCVCVIKCVFACLSTYVRMRVRMRKQKKERKRRKLRVRNASEQMKKDKYAERKRKAYHLLAQGLEKA